MKPVPRQTELWDDREVEQRELSLTATEDVSACPATTAPAALTRFDTVLTTAQVERVQSLMKVPFDQLSGTDAQDREILAVQRLKANLGRLPHYRMKADNLEKVTGDPWAYWSRLFASQVNTLQPPLASS